jgi:uncharacterized protein (DUF305 family)
LKKFANDIMAAQTKEIQDMKNIIAQIDHDNNENHH